jgi:hypothetical protein
LVLGLLPGLEDASGEFYQPVLALLDRFCAATAIGSFHAALWKALLISPHVRMAAVNYLAARLPRDRSAAQLAAYLPDANSLVLHALGKVLADPNGLVQRQALELLNSHFPLDAGPLDGAARSRLVELAIPVVRRREVSLTRRLTSWLMGSPTADAPRRPDYFVRFGRQPTIDAVRAAFACDVERVAREAIAEASMSATSASSSSSSSSSANITTAAGSRHATAHARVRSEVACRPLRTLMFLLGQSERLSLLTHTLACSSHRLS